jgi:hypothetical protein
MNEVSICFERAQLDLYFLAVQSWTFGFEFEVSFESQLHIYANIVVGKYGAGFDFTTHRVPK